jgi:hypothetical protein
MNTHTVRGALAPALLGLLALIPAPLRGQEADAGTLVIRAGGRDVGAETFRVAPDGSGSRITSRTSYSAAPPLLTLEVNVVRRTGEVAFQLDRRRGDGGAQVYAVQRRGRVTIRRVARGAEEASELPGPGDLVLLADSVLGPLLQLVPLATATPRSVAALFPESGRRVSFRVQRLTEPGGRGTTIRMSGALEGEVHLGDRGEVLRISLPTLQVEAHRSPD